MRSLFLFLVMALFAASTALAEPTAVVPAKGTVTLVDLGAKSCVPCRMMIPVLESVEKDYAGRAAVVFIDIRQDPEAGKKYGLRVIPTQIFFDKQGNEALRHEGFLDKDSVRAVLDKLLKQ